MGKHAAEKAAEKAADGLVVKNRKAHYKYTILETYETGVALKGPEVKSIRDGQISLDESYAGFRNGELFVVNLHIAPYDKASWNQPEVRRARKLLMHRRELAKLQSKVEERGLTLVPLKLYFKRGWAKLEIGLAKGKKFFDKREAKKEAEQKREISRCAGRHAKEFD